MGRPLRPTDDGLLYQAINRGNDRRVVFSDDEDHRAFLESLGRTQLRYPFRGAEKGPRGGKGARSR